MRSFLALAIACFLAAACERAASEAGGSARADTASWKVAADPLLHVGSEGTPGHELDRVYGGVLRPDGSVVIGNSGTGELRFYDRGGTLTHTAGRKGSGPGEFQAVSWLRPYRGDSLLAFDMRMQRFSVWSPAGAFGRAFRVSSDVPSSRPVGIFPDGSVVLAVDRPFDPRRGPGVVRDEFELSRIGPTGESIAGLGRFAGTEWLLYQHPSTFGATQVPFGKTGYAAVSGSHVAYASSDSGRITVLDDAGRLVRTIRVPAEPRRLTRAQVNDALREIGSEPEREAIRRHTRDLRDAASPLVADLRVDRSGRLWVRTPASDPESGRWLVFTVEGEQVGSLLMPSGHLPLDMDGDRVLVRETDGDGVMRVSLRRVVR